MKRRLRVALATIGVVAGILAVAGVGPSPVAAGVAPTDPAIADLVKTLKALGATDQEIADLAAATDLDAAADWFLPSTGQPATASGADILAGTFFEIQTSAEIAGSWFAPGGPLASGSPGVVSPVTRLNGQPGTEFYVYATNLAEPLAGELGKRVEAGVAAFDSTPISGGPAIHAPQQGPGDFFGTMNVAWSTRSENGGPFGIHHFRYLQAGGNWAEAPTDAVSIVSGHVLMTLIPEGEASDFETARAFSYVGGLDFDPATVAADTYPDMAAAARAAGNVPVIEISAETPTTAPGATPSATLAATPSPTAAGGGTTGVTTEPPWILLIASGIALAVLGGWLFVRGGKAAPAGGAPVVQVADLKPPPVVPPVAPPAAPPEQPGLAPPPPTTSRPDPCRCGCTATIDGPRQLNVCPCDKLTYQITGTGSTVGTLKGVRPDGSIAFSKTFRCKVAMTCSGGASPGAVSADWSIVRDGDWLTISATGRGEYSCEGSPNKGSCTCTAQPFKVRLLPGSGCVVQVVTLVLGLTEFIGHVAIRLTCGETDELWGYFPKDRASLLAPFKGTPGSVDHRSGSSDKSDAIGKDYSGYYCKNGKRVWAFLLNCDQCEKLRKYWENLEKTPGTYVLASSNCATKALDSLHAAGVPLNLPGTYDEDDEYMWSSDAYRPGLVEDLMNQLVGEGGASQQLDIDPNPNCTSEH